ncbi:putative aldouronate transport system substrate-binding protein [Kribbella aluminosa]|uniref:Aldouronate transport system substrate-binding protein n=1 Tax=Kribbella aluminosa TaxID=416017 RepID=A0ABS4UG06_9ACTN|nr:extracellular solute-binding protein [Kribbella aluminosa]MBP2350538.1 putative aldouronate transport system substrate-binding protein [Kribbella aluminosa]
MSSSLSRRDLLRAGAALGALAAAGPALSACGGGSSSNGNSPQSKKAALPTYKRFPGLPAPDLPGNADGLLDAYTTYPSKLIDVWAGKTPGDGKPLTGLAQLNGAAPPSLDKNVYWQTMNQRLGSPVQMQLVNAGNDFNTKIATMSAGNDFPDIMQINSSIPALDRFLEAKMLDLTPYLSGDKVLKYPALANIPSRYWEACVFNGKLFGLPIPRGLLSAWALYYRSDLVEAAGGEAKVSNFQDLYQLAKATTDAKKGIWAFANSPLDYIRMMLSIPAGWQRVDGKMVNYVEHEHQQQALESARKIVADGLVNPDVAAAPPSQWQQWFGGKKAALLGGTYSAWGGLTQQGVPADKIGIFNVVGYDGGDAPGWKGGLNNNIAVIPAKNKDRAETLLKIADFLASPFGTSENRLISTGVEGHNYTVKNGKIEVDQDRVNERSLGLTYLGAPPPVIASSSDPAYVQGEYKAQQKLAADGTMDLALTLFSETNSRKSPQLETERQNMEFDIILGRKPVSAWADFVTKWRTEGGDKIRTELEAAAKTVAGK